MNPMDPLSNLPDIHLPAHAIGWWPLAPGWWIMIGILFISAVTFVVIRKKRINRNRWRVEALTLLESTTTAYKQHGDSHRYAVEITQLLKRVAQSQLNEQYSPGLFGQAFYTLLTHYPKPNIITAELLDQLDKALYRPDTNLEPHAIHQQCEQWIKALS